MPKQVKDVTKRPPFSLTVSFNMRMVVCRVVVALKKKKRNHFSMTGQERGTFNTPNRVRDSLHHTQAAF